MQRVAFRLWVQPDKLDEYIHHHQAVWPELLCRSVYRSIKAVVFGLA